MSKTLATGAPIDKATWDDFVKRLRYHCEGEGVSDHCTASALFTVQRKTYDYGIDLDFDPEIVVVCDGMTWTTPQAFWDDVEEDVQEELDNMALEGGGAKFLSVDIGDQWGFIARLEDHQVIGRTERWEFVGAHFTKEAAEAFIARKKHDYPEGLRVYVEAQPHAWEFESIKSAIMDGRLVFKEGGDS